VVIAGIRPGKGDRQGRIGSLLLGIPDAETGALRYALWVQPTLIGEVEFANWTPDGILRHARWRGLRPDKTVDEIVVEP
jgi:bifunctional non-homologous end joining protein LigD